MLALCLNQTSADSAAKTKAAPLSPIAAMAIGETTVAVSAATEDDARGMADIVLADAVDTAAGSLPEVAGGGWRARAGRAPHVTRRRGAAAACRALAVCC